MFYRRVVLSVALTLSAVCLLALPLGLLLHAAPAPLPKRAKASPATLPTACAMHWGNTEYLTYFNPDGSYRSTGASSDWVGTWFVEQRGRGPGAELVLYIRERETFRPDDAHWYVEWRIWMTPCLRRGSIGCESGGGEFRLE